MDYSDKASFYTQNQFYPTSGLKIETIGERDIKLN